MLAVITLCLLLLPGRALLGAPPPSGDLGRVRVEAERAEHDAPPPDDPAAVTVIRLGVPGQLGAARTLSLGGLIEGEAGVRVRSAGGLGQWSGALLRGAAPAQVAVLIDGVPLTRGGVGAVDLSQLPVDGVERVEIYRGVPPLELGPDAVGGAINLVTRRGAGPRALSLVGSAGSFGLRRASALYTEQRGPLRAAASLAYQGATGDFPYYYTGGFVYRLDEHGELRRRNDGFDQLSADLRVGYERGGWSLRAQGHGLLRRAGVAGIGQLDAQPGEPDLSTGRALLVLHAGRRLGGGRADLSAEAHALVERGLYRDLVARPAALLESLSAQAGAQLGARLSLRPEQMLTVLLDLRYEALRSADLCPAPRSDCSAAAPSASERLRAGLLIGGDLRIDDGRLALQPGLQLLLQRSRLLPLAGGYGTLSPGTRGAAGMDLFAAPRALARLRLLPGLLLRASVGRFVRLPTFLELFGDRAFFRPNLGLRPEAAWTFEGGLRGELARAGFAGALELTPFLRLVDDLIDTVRDGPQLRARNVGAARMAGLEAELRLRLRDLLGLRLVYTLLDARDLTDLPGRTGNLLPGRPPHSLLVRLDGGYGPLRAYYELDHAAALYLDAANLQPRPDRTLHALGVQLGPVALGALRASLQVEVRNLLDTRVVAVPDRLTRDGRPALTPLVDFFDYPLPGRALYATLGLHL